MKIIIPAAGAGTRLRPHTNSQPKVLLNVAGQPMLAHILDPLMPLRPSRVIFIVGYLGEKIASYVRKNYPFRPVFIDQKRPQGLGHAIYLAREEIKDEPVLIVLGDTIVEASLFKKLDRKNDWLGVKMVKDPHRFGIAETKNGFVRKLIEKPEHPKGNLALVGLYYIKSTRIFRECLKQIVQNKIKTRGEYQLTDALQMMIERGVKFKTVEVKEWYDCGKVETLLETNRKLLEKNGSHYPRLKSALVFPPAYIARPVDIKWSIIGPNVTVLKKAKVHNSVVRNSILAEGCSVQNAVLENSVIGQKARVHGKVKSINLGDWQESGV